MDGPPYHEAVLMKNAVLYAYANADCVKQRKSAYSWYQMVESGDNYMMSAEVSGEKATAAGKMPWVNESRQRTVCG
jgi:hypothetical protein